MSPTPKDDTQKIGGPRLERATLPLTAVASVGLVLALSFGSYFYSQLVQGFRDLASEVRAARDALGAIDRRVSVLEAPGLDARVRRLEERAAVLEAQQRGGNGNGGAR